VGFVELELAVVALDCEGFLVVGAFGVLLFC
jgi:hypothetical protein